MNENRIDWYDVFDKDRAVNIPTKLISCLELMLYDLQTNNLTVYKVPSPGLGEHDAESCYIRAVASKNVEWYSGLCRMHPKPEYKKRKKDGKLIKRRFRKNPETNLKKANISGILNRMIKNGISKSSLAPYLLEIAEDYRRVIGDIEEDAQKILKHKEEIVFEPWDDNNPPF